MPTPNLLSDQFDDILGDQLPDFPSLDVGNSTPTYIPPNSITSTTSSSPLPTYIQAGGSILSGIGGYMQGQESAGADEYNASLSLMEGQFQVQQIGLEEDQTLSTQKAMYATAGVEQSGSVLDTALQTATQYEYSKQVALFNAQSAANNYNYEAKAAKSKGEFALAGGLLSGAIDIAKL